MRTVYVLNNTQEVALNVKELIDAVTTEARISNDPIVVLYYDVPDYIKKDDESINSWLKNRRISGAPDFGVMTS